MTSEPGSLPADEGPSRRRWLRLPDSWVDELAERRSGGVLGKVAAPPRIHLIWPRGKAEGWGVERSAVAEDLSAGMSIRRGGEHPGGERFWLTGSTYEVEALSKVGEGTTAHVALVLRAGLLLEGSLARRVGRVRRPVELTSARDWRPCELGALHQELRRLEKREQRARRAALDALRSSEPDEAMAHRAKLRRRVARRYEALQTLLQLVDRRAELDVVSVEGVVLPAAGEPRSRPGPGFDDPQETVRIELDAANVDAAPNFRDRYVTVARSAGPEARGRGLRGQVVQVRRGVLHVALPAGSDLGRGESVGVETAPQYGYRQQLHALRRFLRDDVEGDWDDLAALLCQPIDLDITSRPAPPHFYCDEGPDEVCLDEAQRSAVAGAIGTPHAFVIQGPPGTGKTAVICEIVRQLAARGERVLLVAPSHVAVDEVLRRIGRKPGVRALRLAGDEGRVADAARPFLPDRVSRALVAALRRSGTEGDERWHARRAGLVAELSAVEGLRAGIDARAEATSALAAAQMDEAAATSRLAQTRADHDLQAQQRAAQVAATAEAAEQARQHLTRCLRAEAEARAAVEAFRPTAETVAAAAATLARSAHELAEAGSGEQRAQAQLADWRRRRQQRLAALDAQLVTATTQERFAADVAGAAAARLSVARADLAAVPWPRPALRRLADRLGVGALVRRQRALAHADAEWRRHDATWQAARATADRMRSEHRWLTTEGWANEDELARRAAGAVARRQAAEAARRESSAAWVSVTTAVTGQALPEPTDPQALATEIGALLADASSDRFLPSDLAPPPLAAAQSLLQTRVSERHGRERARDAAEAENETRRQANARARAAAAAELADLTAQREAARSRVAAAESRLADATRRVSEAMVALGYATLPDPTEVDARRERVARQARVVVRYAGLQRRWAELAASLSPEQLHTEIGDVLARSVNLVCATTVGIASRGAEVVKDVDFDTLIIDEASRVVDSEFLVGAVRSRRWVLVGDEHQLPPHVDPAEEHFLHAMAALHRHERGTAASLDEAVTHLGALWQEDGEQRKYRHEEVVETAQSLRRGAWETNYRDDFAEAHAYAGKGDPDRAFLSTLRQHLVQSLLERVVAGSRRTLRQPLETQRRMIPPLAEIVRVPIYQGRYRSLPPGEDWNGRETIRPLTTPTFSTPVVFLDTSIPGRERQVGSGFVNDVEARWIEGACRVYDRELAGDERVTVSILCFYKAQAELIERRWAAPDFPRLDRLTFTTIAPIDRIQGQESDLVFLCFSRSRSNPGPEFGLWLQDVRRLNVACTRAHRGMVFVGNRRMLASLRTVPEAQAFYGHLLGLFDTSPHFQLVADFQPAGAARARS